MSTTDIVRITEIPIQSKYSLRTAPENAPTLSAAFGVDLPSAIGGVALGQDAFALCLGPDEWEVTGAAAPHVSRRLDDLSTSCSFSAVNVSHRDRIFEIAGPLAETALNAACPANLGDMNANSCARTVFDGVQIVLLKHADDRYRLEVWRSFAPHVLALLQLAQKDISLEQQYAEILQ